MQRYSITRIVLDPTDRDDALLNLKRLACQPLLASV